MKPLRMSIPGAIRPHLKRLMRDGLNGKTEREVAMRLLCEKLRELQPLREVRRSFFS